LDSALWEREGLDLYVGAKKIKSKGKKGGKDVVGGTKALTYLHIQRLTEGGFRGTQTLPQVLAVGNLECARISRVSPGGVAN